MKKQNLSLWAVLFWLLVWQAGSMALHSDILLVSPLRVLQTLLALIQTTRFWSSLLGSMGRILGGFLLAAALGTLLAALAAACEGESLITGTSRLAHKESDRAETLREEYAKVGIEIDLSTPDVMRIRGSAIRPARVFSHGDHRIAMSMAVSALRSSGAITIEGAEAVAKSYPRFFEDLESLRVN